MNGEWKKCEEEEEKEEEEKEEVEENGVCRRRHRKYRLDSGLNR